MRLRSYQTALIALPTLCLIAIVVNRPGTHRKFVASDLALRLDEKSLSQRAELHSDIATVGVFVVVNVDVSYKDGSNDIERFADRELGIGNCEELSDGSPRDGYRLYIIYIGAGEPAATVVSRRLLSTYIAKRIKQVSSPTCRVTVASETAAKNSESVAVLNQMMIGAYLDDNINYFHVILPSTQPSQRNKARNTSTLINLVRNHKNPYATGVVVEMPSGQTAPAMPLACFFSRVHFDIFGVFFPHNLPDAGSAVSFVIGVYESMQSREQSVMRIITGTGARTLQADVVSNSQRWPELFKQNVETLNRYIAAVDSSACFRCPPPSNGRDWRVISMSLYGSGRRYTMGAIRNAQLAPVTYPGWLLRLYIELPGDGAQAPKHGVVPATVIARLRQLGAEIYDVPSSLRSLAPMLWRFTIADDPSVSVFIVRDCDSRLTPRDAAVVNDWLKQDPQHSIFHCIRDHPSHSNYPVSGGLWGGRRAALSQLFNNSFCKSMTNYGANYVEDMNFLGREVWPRVTKVAYCHDSFSCQKYPSSHPFPVTRVGSEHLGQVYDQLSVGRPGDINLLLRAAVNKKCVPT